MSSKRSRFHQSKDRPAQPLSGAPGWGQQAAWPLEWGARMSRAWPGQGTEGAWDTGPAPEGQPAFGDRPFSARSPPRPLPPFPACLAPSDASNVTANNLDFNQEITHPLPAPLMGLPRRKPRPEHPGPAGGGTSPIPCPLWSPGLPPPTAHPPSNTPGRRRLPPAPQDLCKPLQACSLGPGLRPWPSGIHTLA